MSHRHELEKHPDRYDPMGGFAVFFVKFPHGWCWSRAESSSYPEPSARWHGPFEHRPQAVADATEMARKRWRPLKHDVIIDDVLKLRRPPED
jgi:hypothetical protein